MNLCVLPTTKELIYYNYRIVYLGTQKAFISSVAGPLSSLAMKRPTFMWVRKEKCESCYWLTPTSWGHGKATGLIS